MWVFFIYLCRPIIIASHRKYAIVTAPNKSIFQFRIRRCYHTIVNPSLLLRHYYCAKQNYHPIITHLSTIRNLSNNLKIQTIQMFKCCFYLWVDDVEHIFILTSKSFFQNLNFSFKTNIIFLLNIISSQIGFTRGTNFFMIQPTIENFKRTRFPICQVFSNPNTIVIR